MRMEDAQAGNKMGTVGGRIGPGAGTGRVGQFRERISIGWTLGGMWGSHGVGGPRCPQCSNSW